MSELFRREAVEHSVRRLEGHVSVNLPVPLRVMSLLLLAALVAGLALLISTSYARKEVVSGWLVPRGGLIQVVSGRSGVLDDLLVKEGAVVRQGQSLAVVRSAADLRSGNRDGELLRHTEAEARARTAADDATLEKLTIQADGLRRRREALADEMRAVQAQQDTLEQTQALADQALDRGQKLHEKGFLAQAALDTLRGASLAAAQHVAEGRTSLAGYRRQLADLDTERAELPSDIALSKASAQQAQQALAGRRSAAEAEYGTVAVAPVSGRILALPLRRGQTVAAGASVAVVAGGEGQLTAELFVPTRAAGFIRPGQPVRLMYEAYPFEKFGTGQGSVESVSGSALAPAQIELPGQGFREPMFKVTVRLKDRALSAYGRQLQLQPGMLLNAAIVIDRRNLLQWILDPLYAAGRRG